MSFQIVYGIDVPYIGDPDQVVLLTLPDKCVEMYDDELEEFIDANWGTPDVDSQPLVGIHDVVDSLRLAMHASGLSTETQENIIATLLLDCGGQQ